MHPALAAALVATALTLRAHAQQTEPQKTDEPEDPTKLTSAKFSPLAARSLGPALFSGRIADIAVNPANRAEFYIGVASGNVWKTSNAGVTFSPVFDGYGSFAIGCITIDPANSSTVWVGTGENNSQRSVSFGDGVYVSRDAGTSFTNVGLKDSMHIGMIRVDPLDSNTVYVAAMGPLWSDGGDRGIYKSTDGGTTWANILRPSEMTGCNEVHIDPRDPSTLYATAYQRRRHVWTLINGGPESAIYKSTDAGKTWRKLDKGIPGVDKGRIGMTISANPDTLYAIIEAADGEGGIFRSTDRGESWTKQCGYMTTSPQYYNELIADPKNPDRFYAVDTFLHTTDDGGKSMRRVEHRDVHVDWHALAIDPNNTDHLLGGNDGGLYETWDRANWRHFENIPIMQFYRGFVDNSLPFYFVYGGTQDNNTIGGPSRTMDRAGVTNEDWFVCVGGDGFDGAVDPDDPDTVYCEWQDGGLTRFDRASGETVDIKPREKRDDPPFIFNWDSPLVLSPHKATRLYYGGSFIFRSDDRGNTWTRISGELSRGLDRNQFKVMGVIQKPDAVAKHMSTSIFGTAVALSESPQAEGLLYAGTDDGLIHVTQDAGQSWRKIESVPGVPSAEGVTALVSSIKASSHDAARVYATFDNHKMGDYKPYVFVSDDKGLTWRSITGDLPERGTVHTFAEDHINPNLLFVGTEFGAHFTLDAGQHWFKVPGLPTIEVHDLDIQQRENDLVMATFGRGFYIMEDYTPLREVSPDLFAKTAHLFPIRTTWNYVERARVGNTTGRGWSGADHYNAPNPPFGATFTYYLKDKIQSRKEVRKDAEKKPDWQYPTIDALREEDKSLDPKVIAIIRDSTGGIVRQLEVSRDAGLHRATWNLRYPSASPTSLSSGSLDPWDSPTDGPMAPPGTYSVQIASLLDGVTTPLTPDATFEVRDMAHATFAATKEDRAAKFAFEREVQGLQRAVEGSQRLVGEMDNRLTHLRKSVMDTPGLPTDVSASLESLRTRLRDASIALSGDPTAGRRMVPSQPSIGERVGSANGSFYTTQPPTQTHREQLVIASEDFSKTLGAIKSILTDLQALEASMDAAGSPWTPSRVPTWPK
ncbi:MAG TPA: hypothetical protein VHN77_08475 [Phycisphaerales bacterium]|nr:hypothetical protein [Phycisphaerales bacterium]